jgi:hypothetical protein
MRKGRRDPAMEWMDLRQLAHSRDLLLPYLPVGDHGRPIPDEQLLIIGKIRNDAVGSLSAYLDERRLQFVEKIASREQAQ